MIQSQAEIKKWPLRARSKNGYFFYFYLADIRQLGKNLFFPSLALNHFSYYEKSMEIEIKL